MGETGEDRPKHPGWGRRVARRDVFPVYRLAYVVLSCVVCTLPTGRSGSFVSFLTTRDFVLGVCLSRVWNTRYSISDTSGCGHLV